MAERRGALDGLRAAALIGVLLYHSLPNAVPGGFLGVEVFFVLSGYLLTSILLAQHRDTGRVDWRLYAARRFRRLGPALFALLAALVLAAPFVAREDAHRLAGDLYSSLVGLTNWHLIQDHSSYFAELGRPPLVRHLWSLAVEIQFYVLCPILVAWLARRRQVVAVGALGAGIAGSALAMMLLYSRTDPSRAYYGTDARVGAMLCGALVAVLTTGLPAPRARAVRGAGACGAAALVLLFLIADERARLMYPLGFLLTQLSTALVIANLMRDGRMAAALATRSLRWLGERSYGAYLWHWPLVALLRPRVDVTWPPVSAAVVTIGGAILLGHLSYVVLERPFLMPAPPRTRVLAGVQWSLAAVAIAGMSVLVAELPREDPIVSSLRAGQQIVSHQTPVTTTTVASTTTTAPPAPVPAAAPAPPAAPPAPPPAPAPTGSITGAAIGDSVMLGAAPALQTRLGPGGFIDAKVGRQYVDGVDVARQLRAQGRLGQVVVVHLGTNGPPRNSDVDAMVAALEGVPKILFVTVRMPRKWEGATNDAVRGGAARHPNVTLVDWYGFSAGHYEWFHTDGVHLRPAGAAAFADLIAAHAPAPTG